MGEGEVLCGPSMLACDISHLCCMLTVVLAGAFKAVGVHDNV